MNYNKPMSNEQKKVLSEISIGSQKGRSPNLFDAATGQRSTAKQQPLEKTGIHANLPVRGNWK